MRRVTFEATHARKELSEFQEIVKKHEDESLHTKLPKAAKNDYGGGKQILPNWFEFDRQYEVKNDVLIPKKILN